ncbi:hypothetical protein [Oricola cellulosilytica]|uniref:Uncharacterized protein n=1 Tax=Oricola cellulosilytica TaxID=1429082 RepID=A0A4R0PEL8_9HYPH|nr:hypothetical protein [Oricola cellulosilytica]TCD16031.1 hypothetical protein E0D97_00890 [Oricola cellulosilytica]
MTVFEIFRSKQNPLHYVAIVEGDKQENAVGVRTSQNLEFLTRVPDDGEPRIAFDPREAKSRIARNGFHAFAVTIEFREHAD